MAAVDELLQNASEEVLDKYIQICREKDPVEAVKYLYQMSDYDGKDGEKIAAGIVKMFEEENLSIAAAENILNLAHKMLKKSPVKLCD